MRTTTILLLGLAGGLFAAAPRVHAADFTCPIDQGRFAHPHDGAKYFECVKGVATVQTCAPGTLFDDLRKGCTSPGNVRKAPPRKPKASKKKR